MPSSIHSSPLAFQLALLVERMSSALLLQHAQSQAHPMPVGLSLLCVDYSSIKSTEAQWNHGHKSDS